MKIHVHMLLYNTLAAYEREKNLHVLMREKYNNILIRQPRTQVNLQKEELGKAAMTKQEYSQGRF